MARIVSLIILLVILFFVSLLFLKVMTMFFLPLFLAVLLVIMFSPLHRWFLQQTGERFHLSAALTTGTILVIVLAPLLLIFSQAAIECSRIYRDNLKGMDLDSIAEFYIVARAKIGLEDLSPPVEVPASNAADATNHTADPTTSLTAPPSVSSTASDELTTTAPISPPPESSPEEIETTRRKNLVRTQRIEQLKTEFKDWLTPKLQALAINTTGYVVGFVLGFAIMIISVYYFFADGPRMMQTAFRLVPLDENYQLQLVQQFEDISRSVVVATLASAVVQGVLVGLGFWAVGFQSLFLLTVLAMLMAMVPFIGAAGAWVPGCLWLYFHDGRTTAAILLAIYGIAVISVVDNILKPAILHGRSNIHPLIAFLSVLGGIQTLGPIGIFVGPMLVVFLHTVLKMVHEALEAIEQARRAAKTSTT